MHDDVRSLDRLCRYAGLKILWSKDGGKNIVSRNNDDTKNAKSRLKKQQNMDSALILSDGPSQEELRALAGSGANSLKLMGHVDNLVQKS